MTEEDINASPDTGVYREITIGGRSFDARVQETTQAVHIYYDSELENFAGRKGVLQALDGLVKSIDKPTYYHAQQ